MALKDLYSYIAIMYFKRQYGLFSVLTLLKKQANKQTNKSTQKCWTCQDCQIFLSSK